MRICSFDVVVMVAMRCRHRDESIAGCGEMFMMIVEYGVCNYGVEKKDRGYYVLIFICNCDPSVE